MTSLLPAWLPWRRDRPQGTRRGCGNCLKRYGRNAWTRIARTEAKRYELPVRKVRTVLKDQLEHGRWAPDGHSHRLVEFLARLGELSARWSRGLVVIVDELQQLLGPLDVSTLSRLREFVWGMRTEQTPCAVVLTLDTQLEARLGHWAADLLHRVREHSPALQMTGVFTPGLSSLVVGAAYGPQRP